MFELAKTTCTNKRSPIQRLFSKWSEYLGVFYVLKQNVKILQACVNHRPHFRHLTKNLFRNSHRLWGRGTARRKKKIANSYLGLIPAELYSLKRFFKNKERVDDFICSERFIDVWQRYGWSYAQSVRSGTSGKFPLMQEQPMWGWLVPVLILFSSG